MVSNPAVKKAWERFITEGVRTKSIREVVINSWERSASQVNVNRSRAPKFSQAELQQVRQRSPLTWRTVLPIMNEAKHYLANTGSVILITDPQARVLYSQGDDRTRELADEINLQPGGTWHESHIGTNAIGTALAEKKPVYIHADEHFCTTIKKWSCAAALIRHPLDGTLAGVVDVSEPTSTANSHSMAYAVSVAGRLESAIAEIIKENHFHIIQQYLRSGHRFSPDTLIADHDGRLIHVGSRAQLALESLIKAAPFPKIAELGSLEPNAWSKIMPPSIAVAEVDVIEQQSEAIGAIIRVQNRRSKGKAKGQRSMASTCKADLPLPLQDLYAPSAAIQKCIERLRKIAVSNVPILLEGETGVGKEWFAQAIHELSAINPYVPVNTAVIPRDLIASELFGYEAGAFTGAQKHGCKGHIESADGGILGLDEIGEMPLEMQPALLRVLEEGVVYRLGGSTPRPVSVRFISMTNRNLQQEVEAGNFRADLFYRISVARLEIPPLRKRREDIMYLVRKIIDRICEDDDRTPPEIAPELAEFLENYSWPGNVRELRNVVEYMLLMAEGDMLSLDNLPDNLHSWEQLNKTMEQREYSAPMKMNLQDSEHDMIMQALEASGGNISQTAVALGISRSTLYRKMDRYNLR